MLTAFTEIPGGMFPGGSGVAESPAGMFAGSSLISLPVGRFESTFAFGAGLDAQAKPAIAIARKTKVFFNIRF